MPRLVADGRIALDVSCRGFTRDCVVGRVTVRAKVHGRWVIVGERATNSATDAQLTVRLSAAASRARRFRREGGGRPG